MATTEPTPERESATALCQEAIEINALGHDAVAAEHTLAIATTTCADYDAKHEHLRKLDAKIVIRYIIYFIALAAIYCIDLALFSMSTEYWVMLETDNPLIIGVAKFVAPLCFLVAEVFLSLLIVEAREHPSSVTRTNPGRVGWTALGVLIALVMPLVAAYTAMTVRATADDSAPFLMVLVLGTISFCCHVLVLFGGKLAHDAKTYLLYVVRRRQYHAAMAHATSVFRERLKRLEARFIPYVHHLQWHNSAYTPMSAGPFDAEIIDLLRRHFPNLGVAPGNTHDH